MIEISEQEGKPENQSRGPGQAPRPRGVLKGEGEMGMERRGILKCHKSFFLCSGISEGEAHLQHFLMRGHTCLFCTQQSALPEMP